MEPDKLLIVAHPDDEILWGGGNLLAERGWEVIVATNGRHPVRNKEFYHAVLDAGILKAKIFTVPDTINDVDVFTGSTFERYLIKAAKKQWKLVLTHSEEGEYGHAQHKRVHKICKKHFNNNILRFFKVSSDKLSSKMIKKKRELAKNYPSQHITLYLRDIKDELLDAKSISYFFNETLYVKDNRWKIPKIAHQIWIGSSKIPEHKNIFMKSVKDLKSLGWSYKLWVTSDINFKTLPNTFAYIKKAKFEGEKLGVQKWAQISDLMRYELLRKYGGFYFDTNMEILKKKEFSLMVDEFNKSGYKFIGSNEDPCGLDCESHNKKFLSNGFFGCVPRSKILKAATSHKLLSEINFRDFWVNRQTGPFYLRKAINGFEKDVHLIDTYKIYPFVANEGVEREKETNKCIVYEQREGVKRIKLKNKHINLINPCTEYPNAIMMNHFLGGSWDWSDV